MGSTVIGGIAAVAPPAAVQPYTQRDLLTAALVEIGVVPAGEAASDSEIVQAISYANMMLETWATRRLFCYVIDHVSYPFVASQQSYTIGPSGADFTASRPVRVDRANLVLAGTTVVHIPLSVINVQDYSQLGIPALSATFPTTLYYQATNPNGTLWPWPYPTDVANSLELWTWHQLLQFAEADLTNNVAYPPGYKAAIQHSLAEALAVPYGRPITAELERLARHSRAAITSLNTIPVPRMETDIPLASRSGGMQWDSQIRGWR